MLNAMKRGYDLAGRRFGMLEVMTRSQEKSRHGVLWLCVCDCGRHVALHTHQLIGGAGRGYKSCGCAWRLHLASGRAHLRHGHAGGPQSPEYRAWCAMRKRCENPRDGSFMRYGGRGINVCERWRESFEAFFDDMGPRPSAGHSIDRIDNNGPYAPGNCRWATRSQQMRNRNRFRSKPRHLVTFRGRTMGIVEWSGEFGWSRHIIESRLRNGWTVERTMTQPPRKLAARRH